MINTASNRRRLCICALLVGLTSITARGAEAQVCGALPVGSRNAVQATYDGAGDQFDSFFFGLNYGRRLGAPFSAFSTSTVQVGGAVLNAVEVDQYRLNGIYSLAATGIARSPAAVCLSSGLDYRRDVWADNLVKSSYIEVPLVATLSASLPVSERITLSPFIAPALHAYYARFSGDFIVGVPDGWAWESVEDEVKDFDASASAGASVMVGSISLLGAYEAGHAMFAENRLLFRLGFHF